MRIVAVRILVTFVLALGVAVPALAQPPGDGVQLEMPNRGLRQRQGLMPPLQLRDDAPAADQAPADPATQDDAIDEALGDDAFLEDDNWAQEDDWGDGWDDEPIDDSEATAGEEPVADEPFAPDDAVLAEGEPAGEAAPGAELGAQAAHEAEAEAFNRSELLASIVNFLLWLAIVVYLARKPLAAFLTGRRLAVEEGLIEAGQLRDAAEAKYEDYAQHLAHLDEELEKLRGDMIHAGETERDRIIAEAETRAARMRRDDEFVIDQQMKQLRTDLTREAIEAAVTAAQTPLEKQIQAGDQTRLAEAYLGDLAGSIEDDEVRA